jgi:hypothetical protein
MEKKPLGQAPDWKVSVTFTFKQVGGDAARVEQIVRNGLQLFGRKLDELEVTGCESFTVTKG